MDLKRPKSSKHHVLSSTTELVDWSPDNQQQKMLRMLNSSQPSHNEASQRSWLIINVSLFSGLLAFFLLSTLLIDLEFSDSKRMYEKEVKRIYQDAASYKNQFALDWMQVDNTLNHGVRLSFDMSSQVVLNQGNGEDVMQFESAQAKIHPNFVPYLLQVSDLLRQLNLDESNPHMKALAESLKAKGNSFQMQIRIAGHTDAQPMSDKARFKDNVELSSFRAFAVMRYLQIHSALPKDKFSIAGYGEFQPVADDINSPENRRIEVFITPVIKPIGDLTDAPWSGR